MTVCVVVLLEMVDIYRHHRPACILRAAFKFRQPAPVVAAREHITDILIIEITFVLLALRDVDDHAVALAFPGGWIVMQECRVEQGSAFAVGAPNPQLEFADKTGALELLQFTRTVVWI